MHLAYCILASLRENRYRGRLVGADREEPRGRHIAAAVVAARAGGGTGRDTPAPVELAADFGSVLTTAPKNW